MALPARAGGMAVVEAERGRTIFARWKPESETEDGVITTEDTKRQNPKLLLQVAFVS